MKYLAKLDWKLVGLHNWFFDITKRKLKEVEEEIIFTLSLPNFRYSALAHIEREIHKVDNGKYGSELTDEIKVFLDNIVHFCKESNIYMEVNESSMIYNEGGATDRLVYWLKQAKDNGNMISLGTDAHSCYEVGRFDNVLRLLNEIGYPKDLIINCDNEKLLELKNN